jgi:AcrR family transcriptional regulator
VTFVAEGSRVREALLDAAYQAVASGEWQRTRMADVATTAGVSRQTLYNEFGSKDGLAAALVWRRIDIFLSGIDTLLLRHTPGEGQGRPDVAAVISDSVRWVLAAAQNDPLLRAILTSAQETELMPFLTTRGGFLVTAARDRVVTFGAGHWPWLDSDDVRMAAECVVRLIVSHLMFTTEPVDATVTTITVMVTRMLRLERAEVP